MTSITWRCRRNVVPRPRPNASLEEIKLIRPHHPLEGFESIQRIRDLSDAYEFWGCYRPTRGLLRRVDRLRTYTQRDMDGLKKFAHDLGEARFYWLPILLDGLSEYVDDQVLASSGERFSSDADFETHRQAKSPWRVWRWTPVSDPFDYSASGTLLLPKKHARIERLDDLVPAAVRTSEVRVYLTYRTSDRPASRG